MAEAEALSAAQSGAAEAATAAAAAVAGAVDPVAMANAQASAAAAKAASDMAAAATDSATAMEHQAAAEAARDMAVEAGMTRGLAITTRANAGLQPERHRQRHSRRCACSRPGIQCGKSGQSVGSRCCGDSRRRRFRYHHC